jgi:antitoxin (DNA-binding transcriptional repressor) of toxin-antitoxin stability system
MEDEPMETKVVGMEDAPRWGRLIQWIRGGYLDRQVVIQDNGEPVAVLLDVAAARCALAIAERLRERRPPFTQDALDKWIDEVLGGLDVSEFMSAEGQPADVTAEENFALGGAP